MERIYQRVKYLTDRKISVWMYTADLDKISISSVEVDNGKYYCTGYDEEYKDKKIEMESDEDCYETVNYCAPLFH